MLPKPVGQFVFRKVAGGKALDRPYRVSFTEGQFVSVEIEEQIGHDPGRALVSIDERVIARDPESIGRRQYDMIVFAIFPAVSGPGQCRLEPTHVAHTAAAAMLRKLPVVDRQRNRFSHPCGFEPNGHTGPADLLGQRAKHVTIPPHNALGSFHLRCKIRIGRGDANAVRRLRDIERIAHTGAQAREQFLRQDNPGGVADLGDLEGSVHTRVITADVS